MSQKVIRPARVSQVICQATKVLEYTLFFLERLILGTRLKGKVLIIIYFLLFEPEKCLVWLSICGHLWRTRDKDTYQRSSEQDVP